MRFFDGGGHLIVTQLREYSRPKAVVVLEPISSRCGGAVGCRTRGGLHAKCPYIARPPRGAGAVPATLPVAKVPPAPHAPSATRSTSNTPDNADRPPRTPQSTAP